MIDKNKEKLEEIFRNAEEICGGSYTEDSLQTDAKFLDYLADYLRSQVKSLRELDALVKVHKGES